MAWHARRADALGAAAICAAGWQFSNDLAGMDSSDLGLSFANAFVQAAAFAFVGVLIAGLRASQLREQALSRIDSLTGLLNRRSFHDDATRQVALCRRYRQPLTLAYLDLDNFKTVNDDRGHAAGDAVLERVAQILERGVRAGDLVSRQGGDEFAILLPHTDLDGASAVLGRLRATLARALTAEGYPVTASIGGAVFRDVPEDLEHMLALTDELMYLAKSKGRNRLSLQLVTRSLPEREGVEDDES